MNKKIIITFVIAILIVVICIISYSIMQNGSRKDKEQLNKHSSINAQNFMEQKSRSKINESENNDITNHSKIAVIYFSATGTTEKIAKYIRNETKAELIKIEPKEPYTSADLNYSSECRANREQNDENARPEIKNTINVEDYDIIYLGYPIWWGTVPKIILTFLDNYHLEGKTVIPFCTSGGSGISKSQSDLKSYQTNINWRNGKEFTSSSSQSNISSWIKEESI